jgi:hypothetical protein
VGNLRTIQGRVAQPPRGSGCIQRQRQPAAQVPGAASLAANPAAPRRDEHAQQDRRPRQACNRPRFGEGIERQDQRQPASQHRDHRTEGGACRPEQPHQETGHKRRYRRAPERCQHQAAREVVDSGELLMHEGGMTAAGRTRQHRRPPPHG